MLVADTASSNQDALILLHQIWQETGDPRIEKLFRKKKLAKSFGMQKERILLGDLVNTYARVRDAFNGANKERDILKDQLLEWHKMHPGKYLQSSRYIISFEDNKYRKGFTVEESYYTKINVAKL